MRAEFLPSSLSYGWMVRSDDDTRELSGRSRTTTFTFSSVLDADRIRLLLVSAVCCEKLLGRFRVRLRSSEARGVKL